MSNKNPEYDFKWCPGCGDFGVRRALELTLKNMLSEREHPIEQTVVVAGIGCSGNLVHLLEGPQPYGFHGIHGRTLPIALGIKMSRPDLNVIIVAGDGDFLSIGLEHIAPQASRNLDVTAIIMDNGVYGLTKGQGSPTTESGDITSSTPYGKLEQPINPLELYLSMGVSFVASGFSSKVKDLSKFIQLGIDHPGLSIVNVQSPCTTYNDTYQELKGNPSQGIAPVLWDIPDTHDESSKEAAYDIVRQPGIPIGIVHQSTEQAPMHTKFATTYQPLGEVNLDKLVDFYKI